MLPFPCPPVDSEVMRTVPNDRVALKKKNLKGSMREALVCKVCNGPGPQRLSFLPSDLELLRVCLRESSEDESKNILCKTLSNCRVPLGEEGFL